MKIVYLIIGIILGGLGMYILGRKTNFQNTNGASRSIKEDSHVLNWKWPDTLDALVAAPKNHELVFENDELRVLKVTVVPGIIDPIHTHKGKSIIWVTKTSPILYNLYNFSSNDEWKLIKTDTINVKTEELFKGAWENPEPPHSVENIGKDTFQLYRIEYKTKT